MIRTIFLFLILLLSHIEDTNAAAIVEATAVMNLSWDASENEPLTVSDVYDLEEAASLYFNTLLGTKGALGTGNQFIKATVDVRSQSVTETQKSVVAIISCTYFSEGILIALDTLLMQMVDLEQLPYSNPKISFRPYKANAMLGTYENTAPTAADKGLIAATAFLSVMLVVVSSVLLHITGGWTICKSKLNNCLFEEVEEIEYDIDNKSTFHVESVYDNDEGSIETGTVTNASGVLGMKQNGDVNANPAAGLGVQTPARDYAFDDQTLTPLSSNRPLGIQSMRKMPKDPEKGGLTNMIMERLTNYSAKKKDPETA